MEQDPREIVESVKRCIEQAVQAFLDADHSVSDIMTIGITTQRETTVVWDSQTGEPLHNAIAWPDTRTNGIVRELKKRHGADKLQGICGLPLSTYPSALKLIWLLRNSDQVQKSYEQGQLVFGTVDTWLLYNLNGKEKNILVTDVTNASRTMLVNLYNLEYDAILLDFFQFDRRKITLPKILPSCDADGFGSLSSGPLQGIKITGCLGDQSAALVGQLRFSPGLAKNTYGTGCFLLYNVGEEPVISTHGLLATVAYQFGVHSKPVYALEGSIAAAGSAVQFLMKNFEFFKSAHEIDDLAKTVKDNGGCVFVTAFSGLFAPYWIDDAQGTIFGITHHTEKGHIARAVMEATCFQTKAILEAMEKDSGRKLAELAVDGGMSNSDLCMQVCVFVQFWKAGRLNDAPALQTQANIINMPVCRPLMRETTSLGAAMAAGFAAGVWKDIEELRTIKHEEPTIFQPQISKADSDYIYKRWERAVEMSKGWMEGAKVA